MSEAKPETAPVETAPATKTGTPLLDPLSFPDVANDQKPEQVPNPAKVFISLDDK